jgi:hypothetical protein
MTDTGYMTKRDIIKALEDFDDDDCPQVFYDLTGDGMDGFFIEGFWPDMGGFVIVHELDAEEDDEPVEDIRGKGRQPHESWDEYCSRVDDEVREAGEVRYGIGPVLFVTILIFIAACVGFMVWRYYQ